MEQFKVNLQIRCVATQASMNMYMMKFSLDTVNGNEYKSNFFEHL